MSKTIQAKDSLDLLWTALDATFGAPYTYNTGGGAYCERIDLPKKRYLLVSDGDDAVSATEKSESVCIGVYRDDGEDTPAGQAFHLLPDSSADLTVRDVAELIAADALEMGKVKVSIPLSQLLAMVDPRADVVTGTSEQDCRRQIAQSLDSDHGIECEPDDIEEHLTELRFLPAEEKTVAVFY